MVKFKYMKQVKLCLELRHGRRKKENVSAKESMRLQETGLRLV